MKRNLILVAAGAAAILSACGGDSNDSSATSAAASAASLKVSVLSSDPSQVTGGDVLVAVTVPTGAQRSEIKLALNNADVTDKLVYDNNSSSLRGLVSGLAVGANTLSTSVSGLAGATLTVTNHPIGGPIFSGPQMQPWACATVQAGLGAAQDAQCNAATKTEYFYMSRSTGDFAAYNPASPPAASDIASTTTDQNITMPYVVRLDTGTLDRATYQIAVLADPTKTWTATAPQAGWNHKVYIPLQGGFAHAYSQSVVRSTTAQEAMLNDMALKRGFMVTKTSFLQSATNLEWVRGAESLQMLKERIREQFGSIRYTFSSGPSGGSMTQLMVANNYPGLLQGIIPMSEFNDLWGAATQETYDCIQLNRYFKTVSPTLWSRAADRIAVFGEADETTCNFFSNVFTPSITPSIGYTPANSPEVPASFLYNASTNPKGARGTAQDYQVNSLGRRPQNLWTAPEKAAGFGFALSLIDNVGVQYGLKALTDGKITPEQFVDVNEKVGGLDIDAVPQAARHQQDPGAAALAYRMGFINDASRLNQVAIISVRRQDVDPIASHSIVHSFIFEEALKRGTGSTANRAFWMINNYDSFKPHELSFVHMDRWLTAVEADTSNRPVEQKVVANKPANVVDGCWDPATTPTLDNQVRDVAQCVAKWFPVAATPRIVAAQGSRAPSFVTKCQLKPLVRTDYPVAFTEAQWARLQATFGAGVCDWSKPDANQTASLPWLDYSKGPGGVQFTNVLP